VVLPYDEATTVITRVAVPVENPSGRFWPRTGAAPGAGADELGARCAPAVGGDDGAGCDDEAGLVVRGADGASLALAEGVRARSGNAASDGHGARSSDGAAATGDGEVDAAVPTPSVGSARLMNVTKSAHPTTAADAAHVEATRPAPM
jgi:hypothetical protein